jgi:pilus assembly protein Flp/PilA
LVSKNIFSVGVFAMLQSVVSKVVRRFVQDDRGATMLEYGLLVGLIAIVAIGAIGALGGSLSTFFNDTTTELNNV